MEHPVAQEDIVRRVDVALQLVIPAAIVQLTSTFHEPWTSVSWTSFPFLMDYRLMLLDTPNFETRTARPHSTHPSRHTTHSKQQLAYDLESWFHSARLSVRSEAGRSARARLVIKHSMLLGFTGGKPRASRGRATSLKTAKSARKASGASSTSPRSVCR